MGELDMAAVFDSFHAVFNNTANVRKQAHFDAMTHFEFQCLLPGLLTVEDRMSMAHGLESRVLSLDHPLVELAASVPPDVKFSGGRLKKLLKDVFTDVIPRKILGRRDKMGFPVPLREWFEGPLNGMISDIFGTMKERDRPFINANAVLAKFDQTEPFSRKTWGLLSLELWYQTFQDRASEYQGLLHKDCVKA